MPYFRKKSACIIYSILVYWGQGTTVLIRRAMGGKQRIYRLDTSCDGGQQRISAKIQFSDLKTGPSRPRNCLLSLNTYPRTSFFEVDFYRQRGGFESAERCFCTYFYTEKSRRDMFPQPPFLVVFACPAKFCFPRKSGPSGCVCVFLLRVERYISLGLRYVVSYYNSHAIHRIFIRLYTGSFLGVGLELFSQNQFVFLVVIG